MNKPDIIKQLKELNVEFDSKASKEELEQLLNEVLEKEAEKSDTIKQEDKPKFFIPEK